jgi:hypothetical protein
MTLVRDDARNSSPGSFQPPITGVLTPKFESTTGILESDLCKNNYLGTSSQADPMEIESLGTCSASGGIAYDGPTSEMDFSYHGENSENTTSEYLLKGDNVNPITCEVSQSSSPALCDLLENSTKTGPQKKLIEKLIISLEVPAQSNYADFAKTITIKSLQNSINLQSITKGLSMRELPSAIIEVANQGQLARLKKIFPQWKEAKKYEVSSQDHLVVILNRNTKLPNECFFAAALTEFGKVKSVKAIKPLNLLAIFETKEAALKCTASGGIMVQGRRYQTREFIPKGNESEPRVKHAAWLYNLPAYVTDVNISSLMSDVSAHHWTVRKRRFSGQTKTWAKVVFNSAEGLKSALKEEMVIGSKVLIWSDVPLCARCGQKDHLSLNCSTMTEAHSPASNHVTFGPIKFGLSHPTGAPKPISPSLALSSSIRPAYNSVAQALSTSKVQHNSAPIPSKPVHGDLIEAVCRQFQKALEQQARHFQLLFEKQEAKFMNMIKAIQVKASPFATGAEVEITPKLGKRRRTLKGVSASRPVDLPTSCLFDLETISSKDAGAFNFIKAKHPAKPSQALNPASVDPTSTSPAVLAGTPASGYGDSA